MIINKRHTGLVVNNLSLSIKFYESLGLKVWNRQIEKGNFISKVVGIKNVEIETAKLKIQDGSLLELLEYKSPKKKNVNSLYPSNRHGCSHVSFTVKDIDKISKLIVSIGGSIVNLPQVSENGTHKVMYCHDIDGIIVELVQEL
mgnify:FL=1|tara:strand:+ start:4306 stop:4737 length:432 start_codon:yes stop_codon:yes gene_type:complete